MINYNPIINHFLSISTEKFFRFVYIMGVSIKSISQNIRDCFAVFAATTTKINSSRRARDVTRSQRVFTSSSV